MNEFFLLMAFFVSVVANFFFISTGRLIQKERDEFAKKLGRK